MSENGYALSHEFARGSSPANLPGLQVMPEAEFEKVKLSSKDLFICAYAVLAQMSKFSNASWGYALFDSNCCLLKLFGHKTFLEACQQRGILRSTIWDEAHIGRNAVASAQARCVSLCTAGQQHDIPALADMMINAAPLFLDAERVSADLHSFKIVSQFSNPYTPFASKQVSVFGSVAVLSLLETNGLFFSSLAEAAAREICLQLHWFSTLFEDISETTASIAIDQSRKQHQITIISSNVYRFFKLPSNISYRLNPLDSIIDPLPSNKEFWNIIDARQLVRSLPLTITSKGRAFDFNITTKRSIEPRYQMVEFIIYFQIRQKISKILNQYTGNTVYFTFDNIICQSPAFRKTLEYAKTAALSGANILMTGESGVGKDVLAQAIHNASRQRSRPFVAVNCAVFSKELIASELFGYEAGAFTGAKKSGSIGKFEMADHGTLFLDEIGDMPLDLQAHLLRAIEQKRFMRVGGVTEIEVDVRILAATNMNLRARIAQNLFREDLFYRLNIIGVTIPPLRERREDIIPLAEHFIRSACQRYGKPQLLLSDSAKEALLHHSWPGNVRELQNLIEGIVSTSDTSVLDSETIIEHLHHSLNLSRTPPSDTMPLEVPPEITAPEPVPNDRDGKRKMLLRPTYISKQTLVTALEENGYHIGKTAKQLNISRRTLYRRLDEYGLMGKV